MAEASTDFNSSTGGNNSPVCPILDGTFFRIVTVSDNGNAIKAACVNCPSGKKPLSGTFTATINFLTHLKKCHADIVPKYLEHRDKCKEEVQKRKKESNHFTPHYRIAKRPKFVHYTLEQAIRKDNAAAPILQKNAEQLILNYVVNSSSPISHVEHPSFIHLVRGFAPHINVLSRRTLSRRIIVNQRTMILEMKQEIEHHDFMCTTADAWTGFKNRRSFLGVTCHVLDDDLKRKSFALACRFFPGKHTFNRIGKLLSDVHEEFNIPVNKITCYVTDNGSNFVKAFKEFQVDLVDNQDNCEEEDAYAADDIQEIDLHVLMQSPEPEESVDEEFQEDSIVLPIHQRCASHTLNLVGCNSPQAAAKVNAKFRSLMYSSNAKSSAIWNKVNSPQSNEKIQEILSCQLVTPVVTRWNSYYDSIRSLILHGTEKLDKLCTSLQLPLFKELEMSFMKEEIQVLTPLAQGLDRLQGQSNPESYMAFLFPTLLQLQHNYNQLAHSSELKYCSPLADAILKDINSRFENYFTFSESCQAAALASITHPAFKLRWMKPDVVEKMKNLFLNTLKLSTDQEMQQSLKDPCHVIDAVDSKTLDFFTFMGNEDLEPRVTLQSQAELEGLQYLDDQDKTLGSLIRYPRVRNMFKKFNVALPSSAAVERLFSVGGMICSAKRNRLKPELFESLLLQRVNNMAKLTVV